MKQASADDAGAPPAPANGSSSGSANGLRVNLGNGSSWSFVSNRFGVHKLTMDAFVSYLERFADRTMLDMTGLKRQYDLTFGVNPEDGRSMMLRNDIAVGISLPSQARQSLETSSSAPVSDALENSDGKLTTVYSRGAIPSARIFR